MADMIARAMARNLITTNVVSTMNSWVGFVNWAYPNDNATRIYILPKAPVTTGEGGAIKIFADAYQNDPTNYRDFGIYFSADQQGDTGHNGKGVFWLNSKVNGTYAYQNPDIGFSFQDGAVIGGRFIYINDGTNPTRAAFIIGSGDAYIAANSLYPNVVAEVHGDVAVKNTYNVRFLTNGNGATAAYIQSDLSNNLVFGNTTTGSYQFKANGGSFTFLTSGNPVFNVTSAGAITNIKSISATSTAANNLRGINVPYTANSTTTTVTFGTAEPDANYAISITPSWNTTHWVTNKTTTGFTVNWGTTSASAQTFDWILIR
jgi:hypothetical protein